jgi:hypothetical protein
VRLVEVGLGRIRALREERGLPHWVVLDEAHYSLHPGGVSADAFVREDKGFCLVTHRASWLRPLVVDALDFFILARTTRADDVRFLRGQLPRVALEQALGSLPAGEFLLADRAGMAMTFVAPPRLTSHVRHLHKYADRPLAPDQHFVFRDGEGASVALAGSLGEFLTCLSQVDDAVLEHHARRGDFSRWVRDVYAEPMTSARLRKIERRWGRGEIGDLRVAIAQCLSPTTPGVFQRIRDTVSPP